jgi:hypothetical protein
MTLFGWYRDGHRESLPLFGGVQGDEYRHTLEESQHAFDRALLILKQRSKYTLDISTNTSSIWSQELKR